ncbi:DUF3857 domain-containing protein [uncultured Bacteroides sp.]|uniref:DUF3857 domain-containing protein n=1 Tax=uncultured Bacteroides sp. TaxID=162156 RepID=UPI002AAAA0E7|nr:DUF3857 domain-containing protein [uncultured Bacteroides sp.]
MYSKRISAVLGSILICGALNAQEKLTLSEIPDSLKQNAYSVVRLDDQEFTYKSIVSGEQKSTTITTILESKGNDEANFICSCDQFEELRNFRGGIYDANGNLIRKIKQSDLKSTEYTSDLASDQKRYYYDCDAVAYPFTVKYEWEIKYKNGLIGLPTFAPQSSYNQSVEKAVYHFYAPDNVDFLYKVLNIKIAPEIKKGKEGIYKEWMLTNLKAIEDEPYTESIATLIPLLYIVPKDFIFDNTHGDLSSWKTYGNWQYGLLKDRDILSDETKKKLIELTKDCKSDHEKVKVLYDYLAKTTRYVSIQLGIGGFQPMPAEEVVKTGFADCKGLSNYMRAMLKELGISSTYTVISTERSRLFKDYASANQMNHVILQVPLKDEILWLECTNPELPFGFVHSSIAGHDAILIKETGGELYRLPTYKDSLNTESHNAIITLTDQGSATASVTRSSHLFQYESMFGFTKMSPTKQIDYLREDVQLPQARVNSITYKEEKSAKPSITLNYKVDCEKYGSKTGNRLFIPINVFRQGPKKLANKKRIHPIHIGYGYMDSDTITLEIPKNYTVESLPKLLEINKKFGKFNATIGLNGNKILITNQLFLRSGEYAIKEYSEFSEFCKEVSNAYASKIILKKSME